MRYRTLSVICAVLAFLTLLAAIGCGALWFFDNYVLVSGHLYPAHQKVLDLREEELSISDYNRLSRRLPETSIDWKVPFQGQRLDFTTREVSVNSLSDGDLEALLYLPWLETVHAENCKDYDQLMALRQELPGCRVLYQVTIGDQTYDQDTTAVAAPTLNQEQVKLLTYLPGLESVNAAGCTDFDLVKQTQAEHPEWNVVYVITLGGEEVSSEAEELTVENATTEELTVGLPGLTRLKQLTIINPAASDSDLAAFQQKYSQVNFNWYFELLGQRIDPNAEELDLSETPLESVKQVEGVANRLPNLKKLILEAGAVSNEEMAAFREAHREDYKVVWTVYFTSKCKARTDETIFMPIKQGEYYFQEQHVEPLKYCEDMICIDVGHAPIKSVDFASYMPHLKYLILAHTQVSDISALRSCKELIFLEIDWSIVRDYEPLTGCTALEDLNIGKTYADVTPLCSMTWLKNLWCVERGAGAAYTLSQALPNTHVMAAGDITVGYGWRSLPNYYAMRDLLGMPYML